MNFKKHARQLERFLEEELAKSPPLAVFQDGSLAYKNFIIKHGNDKWNLKRPGGDVIDSFNLKVCAIIAAKLYSGNNFENYNEIKRLDQDYTKNNIDADLFKYRYTTTTDTDRKDLFEARYIEARDHVRIARKKIASRFKMLF